MLLLCNRMNFLILSRDIVVLRCVYDSILQILMLVLLLVVCCFVLSLFALFDESMIE
jgi:hypothetical protein